jgi:hypothetical protein
VGDLLLLLLLLLSQCVSCHIGAAGGIMAALQQCWPRKGWPQHSKKSLEKETCMGCVHAVLA